MNKRCENCESFKSDGECNNKEINSFVQGWEVEGFYLMKIFIVNFGKRKKNNGRLKKKIRLSYQEIL